MFLELGCGAPWETTCLARLGKAAATACSLCPKGRWSGREATAHFGSNELFSVYASWDLASVCVCVYIYIYIYTHTHTIYLSIYLSR